MYKINCYKNVCVINYDYSLFELKRGDIIFGLSKILIIGRKSHKKNNV